MKPTHRTIVRAASMAALFPVAITVAHAQYTPVWYDGYAVSVNSADVNFEYTTRQGGVLAAIDYSQSPAAGDFRHQLKGQTGDVLQLASSGPPLSGVASPNYSFTTANGNTVGKVSFKMRIGTINNTGNFYTWSSFALGADNALVTAGSNAPHFGVRFVHDTLTGNGNYMQFYDGADTPVLNLVPFPAGLNPLDELDVTLYISDPTDDNPWDGIGSSVVRLFLNNRYVAGYTKTGGGYTNNYMTMQGSYVVNDTPTPVNLGINYFDELTVSTAPASLYKADNTDNLNLTTSWTGGVVPGAADIAQWSSTVTTANATVLGADLSFGGLKVTNPGGDITIGSGNTLTLGNNGIDLSGASQNLTISSGLTLGTGQTWTVNAGRTLTHDTGAFTRNAGATLLVDQSYVAGTVTASPTLVNGVVPWGMVKNGGVAANGSGNGYTFATVTGGDVVPYTAATAATTAGSTWGGIPSGGTGLINYDVSMTTASTGLNRNINTLRYIGGAATQNGNTAAVLMNVNCILNAGTGTFTIGGGGTAGMGISSSSTDNELVLAAASAGITFGSFSDITNNGANATAVTVTGPYNVTLLGTNTYTGDTTVNSDGTLVVDGDALANAGTLRINGTGKDGRGKVAFTGAVVEVVDKLFINGVQMAAGTYGATGSGATQIDDAHFAGAGVVQVTTGPAIPAGYATWASTNAPSGGTGDDFDGDGVANGVEYVLGGDKDTNDLGKLPTAGTAGANFVFTFNRAKASNTLDTTVKIEVSNNLAAWPVSYTVGTSPEVTVTDIDANWEQVTLSIVRGTDPAKFARLKVEVN